MRDETVRLVTSAVAIGIGLVFVTSGLALLNAGTETDPAYRQAGILLLPGGLLTIAVAVRWQLPVLLSRIILERRAKLLLVSLATIVLLFWGVLSQIKSDAIGGLAGLLFGLGFLAVFLRMITRTRRPLSPGELETVRREMKRASLRPLGVTILAGLLAADGVSSILVAVFLAMVEVGYYPRTPSFFLPTLLVFLFFGFLKTSMAFGLSNGSGWAWDAAIIYNSLYFALSSLTIVQFWPFLFALQAGPLGPAIFLGNLVPVVILGLMESILTLYYLNRAHVKSFFRKVRAEKRSSSILPMTRVMECGRAFQVWNSWTCRSVLASL